MVVPLEIAFGLVVIRWSPLMAPYHAFGGKENLMKLEREGSLWYWSVLLADWTICTAGVLVTNCYAAVLGDTFLKINLITRAMR